MQDRSPFNRNTERVDKVKERARKGKKRKGGSAKVREKRDRFFPPFPRTFSKANASRLLCLSLRSLFTPSVFRRVSPFSDTVFAAPPSSFPFCRVVRFTSSRPREDCLSFTPKARPLVLFVTVSFSCSLDLRWPLFVSCSRLVSFHLVSFLCKRLLAALSRNSLGDLISVHSGEGETFRQR